MKAKYIVVPLALLGAGLLYFKSKTTDWKNQMTKLFAYPTALRNGKIEGGNIKFSIDVAIKNPTAQEFNPDGIVATLKRINLFTPLGKAIATIEVNKSNLKVPAGGVTVLKDLVVQIPIYQNLLNVAEFQTIIKNKSFKDIKTQSVINVLGQEYII